jgi:hypothetical protein
MDDDYKAAGCVGYAVTAFVGFALLFVVGLIRGDDGASGTDPTAWLVFVLVGVVFILAWVIIGFPHRDRPRS